MPIISSSSNISQLYETDPTLWLEKTIECLKSDRLDQLDIEHLIEELEDLSKRDKNKAASLLEQIIRHLLLLQYWSEEYDNNASHWEAEIDSFRTQLRRHLTTTLHQYLEQELETIYQDALRFTIKKTRSQRFPTHCHYRLENLLDANWLP
ncbi:MAG: DUF29 domain-containing protein [Snowella sp.]|nr:DUF29 domain-containing protein [Snowella sp.]